MEDLERQLQDALKREDAPAWFEAKVLAAAREGKKTRPSWVQRVVSGSRLRWAAAIAAVALVAGGLVWQHERQVREDRERAAGEAAKARLVMALKITRTKLQHIQDRLSEINRDN